MDDSNYIFTVVERAHLQMVFIHLYLDQISTETIRTLRAASQILTTMTISPIGSQIVESARVVVHTTGWLGPPTPMSDNHWSVYLILLGGEHSVRLNMRANYGDVQGILEFSSLPYAMPHSAVKYWDYQFLENIMVGQIYQHLIDHRRHHYRMSGGGSGCRFWVYVYRRS